LALPTLVWGRMLQGAPGYSAPSLPGARLIPALFGTAVFLTVAFLFSAAVTLGYPGMPLWEELATLVTIMLLGHWIEMHSVTQAQGALAELAKLLPNTAERVSSADGRNR
jgi:P-type Cu2+ transporter